jgi:hypothetical protein
MGFVMSNLAWSFGSLVWDSAVPHVWQQPGDQQPLQEQEQSDASPLSMKDASTLAPLAWRRISGTPQGSRKVPHMLKRDLLTVAGLRYAKRTR